MIKEFFKIIRKMIRHKVINKIHRYKYLRTKKPWSPGYTEFKFKYILNTLNDRKLMKIFREYKQLPKFYGYALDERVVEYPWLFSQLKKNPQTILDAGSILNYKELIEQDIMKNKVLHILTLFPEENCFTKIAISYLFADLRDIPIKNDYYDSIVCLSTLEHIGMDNSMYSKNDKKHDNRIFKLDYLKTIKELKRILKPDGEIFISVPYGKKQNFGSFQQFDKNEIDKIISVFCPKKLEEVFFRYTPQGWIVDDKNNFGKVEYFNIHIKKKYDKDMAAAARGVACIRMKK